MSGRHYPDRLYPEPDDALPAHALLRVEPAKGRVERSYTLAESAKVLQVVEPRWDKEPVIALQQGQAVALARAGADTNLKAAGLKLGVSRAGALAVAEDYPAVAATAWGLHGASLRFFDAATGALGKDLELDSPGLVRSLGENRWLVTLRDAQTGRETITEFDQARGRVTPLLSCEGEVTSVALGGRWLYAVSQSSRGPFDPKRKWLHPQELHRVDRARPRAAWTIPWTQHPGRLLGLDEERGKLYYAVTDADQAAVWVIDAEPAALQRAAAAMDHGSALTLGNLSGAALGLLFAVFFFGLVWLLLNPPR